MRIRGLNANYVASVLEVDGSFVVGLLNGSIKMTSEWAGKLLWFVGRTFKIVEC